VVVQCVYGRLRTCIMSVQYTVFQKGDNNLMFLNTSRNVVVIVEGVGAVLEVNLGRPIVTAGDFVA